MIQQELSFGCLFFLPAVFIALLSEDRPSSLITRLCSAKGYSEDGEKESQHQEASSVSNELTISCISNWAFIEMDKQES